jgi:hypothetical protein
MPAAHAAGIRLSKEHTMSIRSIRSIRSTRLSLAAALAAGVTAAAAVPAVPALASGSSHQRFTMTFVSVGGKDRPIRAVAAGPIRGTGTMTQRLVKETPHGEVLAATIKLPDGKVRLRVHDHESMRLDLRSCTAQELGHGTWKSVSGTGAYRTASGSGTFVRRGLIIGAFDQDARCLGQAAAPAVETGTVVTDGTASR